MPTKLNNEYQEAMTRVQKLDVSEKIQLIQALMSSLHHDVVQKRNSHSIKELKGLGKEIWQKIDIENYVNQERKAWN